MVILYAMIAAFFLLAIPVLVYFGITVSNSDASADMRSAIITVSVVNSVMLLILGGTAYYYISMDGTVERPYLMLMMHLSILFSIIALGVSSLHQLNTKVTT